jgi:uncharacterized protein (TIRG00374 family)
MVLVKLAVAGLLLAWLVRSGTVDFGALKIYFDRPGLLVANLAMFVGSYVIAAIRWRLLLRIAGIELAFGRAVQLTLTGAFFNVVAPGNIGGEVLKAIYVARDLVPAKRANVVLVALLDKLIALAGLVVVAIVLNGISGDSRLGDPTLAITILAVVTMILPVLGLVFVRRFAKPLERLTSGSSRIAKLLGRLVAAAQLVAEKPGALALALALSIAIHIAGIIWFSAVASAVLGQHVAVTQMAAVYPLGMLTVLLPISYAGFGVGHLAFEKLFTMVGLTNGANVLNVHLIGQMVPCLFGVIPYLMLKRDATPPGEVEAALLTEPNR